MEIVAIESDKPIETEYYTCPILSRQQQIVAT